MTPFPPPTQPTIDPPIIYLHNHRFASLTYSLKTFSTTTIDMAKIINLGLRGLQVCFNHPFGQPGNAYNLRSFYGPSSSFAWSETSYMMLITTLHLSSTMLCLWRSSACFHCCTSSQLLSTKVLPSTLCSWWSRMRSTPSSFWSVASLYRQSCVYTAVAMRYSPLTSTQINYE